MAYKNHEEQKRVQREWHLAHKEEVNLRHKLNYLKNKSKVLARMKKYRLENPELRKEIARKSYQKNKLKHILAQREYRKLNYARENALTMKRYYADVVFRLRVNVGKQLRHALLGKGKTKNWKKSADVLGYSMQELKIHLEKQFDSNMSWGNYGSYWEIDHVVPVSWFKTVEQQVKYGWALRNLQPLQKKLNFEKKNFYVGNPNTRLGIIYL